MGICASSPSDKEDKSMFKNSFLNFRAFFPDFAARFNTAKQFKLETDIDSIQFKDILNDPTLWEEFSVFVTEQIAEENVLFINDLFQLRDLHQSDTITDSVRMLNQQFLVDEYLALNSPMQLNIPSRMRTATLDTFDRLKGKTAGSSPEMRDLTQRFLQKGEKGLLERNFIDPFKEWYKDQRSRAKKHEQRDEEIKRIVVLGGGPCGISVINCIAKLHDGEKDPKIEIVLIDPKEYFQFRATMPWICLRSYEVGYDQFHGTTFKKYSQIFKDMPNVRVIQRAARAIRKGHVVVGYEPVSYDYLVVTSGSHYPSSIAPTSNTFAHRKKQLAFENKKLEEAQRILLVGGGLVSVETAAELKWRFPDKQVLVIHSHDKFLPRISNKIPEIHQRILDYYDELGIKYQLHTELLEKNPYTHQIRLKDKNTDKVSTIDGTGYHMFWCASQIPNTQMFVGEFAECLGPRHLVKTNQHFQVGDHQNVFCGGDVTNLKQEKCVVHALRHAPFIAHNLLCQLRGQPEKMMTQSPALMEHEDFLISMGPLMGIDTSAAKDFVNKDHLITKYIDHNLIFKTATNDVSPLLDLLVADEKDQTEAITKHKEAVMATIAEMREATQEMDYKHIENLKRSRRRYLQVED